VSRAPEVLVHRDKDQMATATAARLIARIADAQSARGTASVVLTGGRNGNGLLAALASSRLELWWGDERFLPRDDPQRNATQARESLLNAVPLAAERVHEMAPSGGTYGDDVEAAADAYAAELAAAARPEDGPTGVPAFDVLLLGVGPDAHVASLFPGHDGERVAVQSVIGVRGAPKPPPVRISLTLPAIRAAREVWLLAAGEDKADAAALALSGADEVRAPAAGAYGRSRTLWMLDEAAAAGLPSDLRAGLSGP
jgi:6-phosphogluconolactonase